MSAEATPADIQAIVTLVESAGGEAFVSRGVSRVVIGLVGDIEQFATLNLEGMAGVREVTRISARYKLVSREHRRERSVVEVRGVPIGPQTVTLIAGPCAVETPNRRSRPPRWHGRPERPSCAAAPTSHAPRPTPSRGWANAACGSSPRYGTRSACRW
ncbi:hypothetical protein ACFQ1L_38510 [Phytohabitans flavus]|uniref:hypothetical protein n=1 Tax=Phytohabitans flavus TaxID=1076124 RepID=UPI00363713DF